MRADMSPPEVLLWTRLKLLRGEAPRFRRQHPIGPYVADFCCASAKLVIEVDGAAHTEDRQIQHDQRRNAYMRELGYSVLRVPASDLLRDVDEVVQGIMQAVIAARS
jgi:very-short-patch-repair endonuclease